MRSALADNGNDIVSGKSDKLSKMSSSVKRPLHGNPKMRLEDQGAGGDDSVKSRKSSKRGKKKDEYFTDISLKNPSEHITTTAFSNNKLKES